MTLHEQLVEKAQYEFVVFQRELCEKYATLFADVFDPKDCDVDVLIHFRDAYDSDALRYSFYQDALILLENLDEEHDTIPVVLSNPAPLAALYDEWCSNDCSVMDLYQATLEALAEKLEKAQAEQQAEEIESKPDEPPGPLTEPKPRIKPFDIGSR